jgi:hypothetical protein
MAVVLVDAASAPDLFELLLKEVSMRLSVTKAIVTVAALSLPYLGSAAPMQDNPSDPQAVQDCEHGLTAPPDEHRGRNPPITATPMFDLTGDQRLDLFVTVRDPEGHIARQIVCSFDMNEQYVGSHRPWPDEITQWIWQ